MKINWSDLVKIARYIYYKPFHLHVLLSGVFLISPNIVDAFIYAIDQIKGKESPLLPDELNWRHWTGLGLIVIGLVWGGTKEFMSYRPKVHENIKAFLRSFENLPQYEKLTSFATMFKVKTTDIEAVNSLVKHPTNNVGAIELYSKGYQFLNFTDNWFDYSKPWYYIIKTSNVFGILALIFIPLTYIFLPLLGRMTITPDFWAVLIANVLITLSAIIVIFANKRIGSAVALTNMNPSPELRVERRTKKKHGSNIAPKSEYKGSSTSFFDERVRKTFPGVRGLRFYEGKEAVNKLVELFSEPYVFVGNDGASTHPIWWWRYGNLQVYNFKKLSKEKVLLNNQELLIQKIGVFVSRIYWRTFIYIETLAEKPANKPITKEAIDEDIGLYGYAYEEFAVLRGKWIISREEYDDGAAIVKGKTKQFLTEEVELRQRFLTPYNCILAAHFSPINNSGFDRISRNILNKILKNEASLEDYVDVFKMLPRQDNKE